MFYQFTQQKNEDAGKLQEILRLHDWATCDKRFPYLYSLTKCREVELSESLLLCMKSILLHQTKPKLLLLPSFTSCPFPKEWQYCILWTLRLLRYEICSKVSWQIQKSMPFGLESVLLHKTTSRLHLLALFTYHPFAKEWHYCPFADIWNLCKIKL